jgi:hypothetical protein
MHFLINHILSHLQNEVLSASPQLYFVCSCYSILAACQPALRARKVQPVVGGRPQCCVRGERVGSLNCTSASLCVVLWHLQRKAAQEMIVALNRASVILSEVNDAPL